MNLNMGNKPADRQFERETGPFPQHFLPVQPEHGCAYQDSRQSLLVMKFGGTSVGDAACIRKVIEIIRRGSAEGDIVVVVSAMSGVTNQLIETATRSEAGDRGRAAKILEDLRAQHDTALKALIHPGPERDRIARKIRELFEQCERWCESTAVLGQLTPQMRDSISSLGERLSAPLVAAALAAQGVASEAVDATQLVVTDGYHGAADPKMDLTRERCEARLRPLLQQGVIPIVTGFIGATEDGVLTTLGRGGSDYSATILGAVLEADEVWTVCLRLIRTWCLVRAPSPKFPTARQPSLLILEPKFCTRRLCIPSCKSVFRSGSGTPSPRKRRERKSPPGGMQPPWERRLLPQSAMQR